MSDPVEFWYNSILVIVHIFKSSDQLFEHQWIDFFFAVFEKKAAGRKISTQIASAVGSNHLPIEKCFLWDSIFIFTYIQSPYHRKALMLHVLHLRRSMCLLSRMIFDDSILDEARQRTFRVCVCVEIADTKNVIFLYVYRDVLRRMNVPAYPARFF